jgi:hypothetical protein
MLTARLRGDPAPRRSVLPGKLQKVLAPEGWGQKKLALARGAKSTSSRGTKTTS